MKCPKCGKNDLKVEYIPKGHTLYTEKPQSEFLIPANISLDSKAYRTKEECLHKHCRTCHYEWYDPCIAKKMPQEAKKRVYEENEELKDKIVKLDNFITSSDKFTELSKLNQELLNIQLHIMVSYSKILSCRLLNWED